MILTAHQPVYLPWLGLFHKISISDVYCYLDNVQYLKNDWNNRNKIKTSDGVSWLTIPVSNKNYINKNLSQMEIDNKKDWKNKHWKTIYFSYKRSDYFNQYAEFFEDVYKREWIYLTDICDYMLKFFLDELKIDVKYVKATDLDLNGHKNDLIIDLCKKLNSKYYVFGELGKDYADEQKFKSEGINIYYQNYKHPQYKQLWGDFASNLSIIDLLFNVGPIEAKRILVSGNIDKNQLKKLL